MVGQDKRFIAYCGINCGDCPVFKGEIADLAKELMEKLKEADFESIARGLAISPDSRKEFKVFENYPICYKVLKAMDILRCNKICREGGGSTHCEIRECCQTKNLQGCWECKEFEICKKKWLESVNEEVHLKNLKNQ
jgi:hypothetical protein